MSETLDEDEDFFSNAIRGAIFQEHDEEEGPAFDLVAADALSVQGTPFGTGKNIKTLRKARQDVLDGTITLEEFDQIVGRVLATIHHASETIRLPAVEARLQNASPEEREIVDQAKTHFGRLILALERVLQYVENEDLNELNEGMQAAEDSIKGLTGVDTAFRLQAQASE